MTTEKLVYPTTTQDANWQTQPSDDWKGLAVADAWHTDRRLVDYILYPATKGHLETIHPDQWCSTCGAPIASNVGRDSETQNITVNQATAFTVAFDYEFEHSRNPAYGYVNHPTAAKLSFVGNSGIKFGKADDEGTKPTEAAILDVKAYVDMVGGINAIQAAVDANGNVDVNVPLDYASEKLNTLMSGVVYGGAYQNMSDNPKRPQNSPPQTAMEYWTTMKNNYNRPYGSMKIEFAPGSLKIYMAGPSRNWGSPVYDDNAFVPGVDFSSLFVQSHWGSGVIFTNLDIQ